MKIVVPDHDATLGPVATHVERANIARFETYVVNFVEFDHVVVAAQLNRVVGAIVNQIVGHTIANARDTDRGAVSPIQSAEVMNMIAEASVFGRLERKAVTTPERDSAFAKRIECAVPDLAVGAASNTRSPTPGISYGAANKRTVLRVSYFNGCGTSPFES